MATDIANVAAAHLAFIAALLVIRPTPAREFAEPPHRAP
jgi:hypothetical protein